MNSLVRGLAILEAMANNDRPLGVTELASRLGVDKGSAHRLLATLARAGYVEQPPESRRYQLTTKLLELNGRLLAKLKLVEQARPLLAELVARTVATAHLAVLRDGHVVYLEEALPPARIRVDVPVGGIAPAHCTALGKALLAFLAEGELGRVLARSDLAAYTRRTLTDRSVLSDHLALTRSRGYAIDDEEFHEGVRCVASPVRDFSGEVVAALGISGPAPQLSARRCEALAPEVVAVAARLSHRLGFRPNER